MLAQSIKQVRDKPVCHENAQLIGLLLTKSTEMVTIHYLFR